MPRSAPATPQKTPILVANGTTPRRCRSRLTSLTHQTTSSLPRRGAWRAAANSSSCTCTNTSASRAPAVSHSRIPLSLQKAKHSSAFSSAATAGEVQLRSEIFPQFLRRLLTRDDGAMQKPADLLQSAVNDNGTKLRPQRNVARLPVANLAHDLPVELGAAPRVHFRGATPSPFAPRSQATGRWWSSSTA